MSFLVRTGRSRIAFVDHLFPSSHQYHGSFRSLSTALPPVDPTVPRFSLQQSYPTFAHMVARRKQAAACSLVIEDHSKNAFVWHQEEKDISRRLLDGHEGKIYRWRVGGNDGKQRRFLLMEFANLNSLKSVARILDRRYQIKMYDRICILRDGHIDSWRASSPDEPPPRVSVQNEESSLDALYAIHHPSGCIIPFEDYNPPTGTSSRRPINSPLARRDTMKDRVTTIRKLLQGEELLSELQYKIRFFVLHQMEQIIYRCTNEVTQQAFERGSPGSKHRKSHYKDQINLMSSYEILPFGSEVSGFGTADSDLDLCFVTRGQSNIDQKVAFHRGIKLLHSVSIMLERSRKIPHLGRPRLVHNHFTQITRIFRAFVPIIKCRSHLLPGVNIDISVDTSVNSGVQMAAYLYHCTRADPRVRSFVLLLKAWAKHHEIIQEEHGEWFSSFQMTMLGLAFLQSRHLVPTINQWQRRSSCTSNSSAIVVQEERETSFEEISHLLKDFFQFMISFDFWKNAFDLNTGQRDGEKPHGDRDACYIINPFVRELNITKTVTETELERFLSYCQRGCEIMNQAGDLKIEELFTVLSDRLRSSSIRYNDF